MNNKSGLVVIAAGIAAFLVIKGGRDSGSLFGSGGGDSGQPTGTILAGPGTSSPPSTPSSLWSPSPTNKGNNSPQSFGYVTPTGTYITPFPISDKILAAMNGNVQPAIKTYGGSSPQAKSELSLIASKGFPIVGLQSSYDPSTRTAYTFAPETATVEKKLISRQGFDTTGLQGSFDPSTGKITTFGGNGMVTYGNAPLPKPTLFTTPATAGRINSRPIKNNPINTGLDKYGFKIGSQWSPAYAEAGGYHGDSRNYATAVQLKRVPGLFVSSTGVHTAPRY